MHFNLFPCYLEEQLLKHKIPYTRKPLHGQPEPCTSLECIIITSTRFTIAVDTTHGIRYGRLLSKSQQMNRYHKTGHWPLAFETIQEYGYELTDEQTSALVNMLIAQDLQPEYVI